MPEELEKKSKSMRQRVIAQIAKSDRIWSHILFVMTTNLLGVAAGWLGAHFDKEIGCSLFRVDCTAGMSMTGPDIFVGVGICFAVGFALSGDALSRKAENTANRLQSISNSISERTEHLETTSQSISAKTDHIEAMSNDITARTAEIQQSAIEINSGVQSLFTLPPIGYLESFSDTMKDATEAFIYSTTIDLSDDVVRGKLIRFQLLRIIQIVSGFDTVVEHCRYGCNVMLFREQSTISTAAELEHYEKTRLLFAEDATTIRKLRGVLDVVPAYSVASDSDTESDSLLRDFCIPVPNDKNHKNRDPATGYVKGVLPGAVDAFVSGDATAIETHEQWIEKSVKSEHSPKICGDIKAYIESQKGIIECFLSIPLFEIDLDDGKPRDDSKKVKNNGDRHAFAVVNVHRSIPNPLLPKRLQMLMPLLTSPLLQLSHLMRNHYQSH